MRKVKELQDMPVNMVGDGKSPNVFFVSRNGVIEMITLDFFAAYAYWGQLPRNVETMLEDRKWGTICDTSPCVEGSKNLCTQDDSRNFIKQYRLKDEH